MTLSINLIPLTQGTSNQNLFDQVWNYFIPFEPACISENWLCPGSIQASSQHSQLVLFLLALGGHFLFCSCFRHRSSLPCCTPLSPTHRTHPWFRLALGQAACILPPPSLSHPCTCTFKTTPAGGFWRQ